MWTDEKKAQAIALYKAKKPTPENSVEIVKEIAEEIGETPNGVRMILSKAEVYIKKDATAVVKEASGAKKTSKADAVAELVAAITDAGKDVDNEIIDKLTGKAATYFAEIIKTVTK